LKTLIGGSPCRELSRKKPWWVFPFSLANGGLAGSPSTSDVWEKTLRERERERKFFSAKLLKHNFIPLYSIIII
jgi:hypothetical protein